MQTRPAHRNSIPAALAVLMLLCAAPPSLRAQSAPYPPLFYSFKTRAEQGAFLTKIIADSGAKGAAANTPTWCHTALQLVRGTSADTLRPRLYELLGDAFSEVLPDSGIIWYTRARGAYGTPPLRKQLYLLQSLVYCYMVTPQRDSLLHYTSLLEVLIAPLPDTAHMKLMGMNTVAQARTSVNDYERGISAYRFVIQHSLTVKDSGTLLNAFVNTGNAYSESGNVPLAIYYTQQALPYLRGDAYVAMIAYSNLVDYLTLAGSLDSAKRYLFAAESFARSLGVDAMHHVDVRRATILVRERKYAAAEPLLKRALAYYQTVVPAASLVNTLLLYASIDTAQKNYARAEVHLRQLYEVSTNLGVNAYMAENLRMLAAVNEHMGDYREAYTFQKLLTAVNDSLRTDKSERSFAELQTQYQTYKKEEQIKGLQKEGRIKDLEISAARRNKTLLIGSIAALLAASGGIIYIRQLRSKAAMQRQKGDLEMKALRSQMNPHFIFNSLNSIQKYIWESRQDDASEYLTKFARLIRLVLENSQHAAVPLSEELDALRLYIELEHRRTAGRFDYTISIAPGADTGAAIPPLLLQPYVENAIWHGLSPKEGRGKLTIDIAQQGAALHCTITDDGIGRQAAAKMRPASGAKKSSLAMNISSQRIAWLQGASGMAASVAIRDNFSNGEACGTSVELIIPVTHAHA